jgi:N-acetylglucosaminyl-diphospho-decaprenol L-rhamnosyltransferase
MHVAICIVGFRNFDDIQACLAALTKTAHADFEVVICENGGPAAFAALSRLPQGFPGGQKTALIQAADNPGYAGGVNLCMDQTSTADAWWILNPDTLPDPQALSRMCARVAKGDVEAVGCTVHDASGRVASRGGRWNPWLARAQSIDHGAQISTSAASGEAGPISYLSGASMLVSRAFVERVGKMREDYFLYGEEVEWCLRAVAMGERLGVAADANVLHQQGTTTGSVSQMSQRTRMPIYLDERNKLLITRDCFPGHLPVTTLGALIMLFARFARRGAWAQTGYALQGWWSGVRNQRGKPAWIGR